MTENDKNETEKTFSRRNFLKMSSIATGSLVAGTYFGSLIPSDTETEVNTDTSGGEDEESEHSETAQEDYTRAYKFFMNTNDFQTIEAAAERIFPEDDLGPGAAALGVGWFIDHELASGWGSNAKEYMKGPFKEGTDYQGPQYALYRKDLFMLGIRKLNEVSQEEHDVEYFHELEPGQQEDILIMFQDDEVEFKGTSASNFFEELRLATLSGAYADPLYRGNKGMEGWTMKKFNGAYMSYLNEVEEDGVVQLEPLPLSTHAGSQH